MKRIALILLFLFAFVGQAAAAGCTGTGNCYWEGGTDNWSNTAKWCTTDTNPCTGTTGGLPGTGDNCNFTATSNATAYTVTLDVSATCKDMTWALPGTSGVPTLAGSVGAMNIYGSLTLITGMSWSHTNTIAFQSTATGKTITTNAVSTAGGWSFQGAGGGWTLQDNLTLPSNRTLDVTAGTLNTNAKTVTTGFFTSTSGTRTLTLTGSTINITGTSGTPWGINNAIGSLTFTATGSTLNITGGGAGVSMGLAFGGVTYGAVSITGPGVWNSNSGSSPTLASFSYTSTVNKTDRLLLNHNITIAVAGSLTIAGNSSVNRAFVSSLASTLGTQRSISVPSGATVNISNADFQDINFTGTFSTGATASSIGDALGNTWGWSSVQPDASSPQTLVGTGTINWSTAANWTSRVPLPQDDVDLGNSSTATTLTADMPRLGRNITSANYLKTLSFASTPNTIFGNITLGAGATYSGTSSLTLAGRGAQTITSNGKAFTQTITVAAFGGSYTLQDNFSCATQFAIQTGTFNDGGHSLSAPSFVGSGASASAIIQASGQWTLSIANSSPWNGSASGLSVVASGWQINLSGTTTTTTTFTGGGKTYGTLNWSSTTSTGTLIITGANSFASLQSDNTTARTWQFPAGVTQTIRAGGFRLQGRSGAVITIQSDTPGSAATLSSQGVIKTNFLSIKDSAATGGARWCAGAASTNVSGNTGWVFGSSGCQQLKRPGRHPVWLLDPANDNTPAFLLRKTG